MKYLKPEARANALAFAADLLSDLQATHASRVAYGNALCDGYSCVVSLQAWRTLYFEKRKPADAVAFFLECQNDALQSVALSLLGMWRPAMQSLRSALEGCMNAVYYADHPVEALLWARGEHRLQFNELVAYFGAHPAELSALAQIDPLPMLQKEYSELSRAVHGSSLSFRMTVASRVNLTRDEDPLHAMWLTRHRRTLTALNLLLCGMYREDIRKADFINLRKSISLAVPKGLHPILLQHWRVRLFDPS